MLVTADNLVQMYFGWEGVGLASYLLIGFWYHKPEANAAAIKAFVVNRVGDFGFALGIFALFMLVGAIDFDTVFAQAPSLTGKTHLVLRLAPGRAHAHLPAAVHGRHGQIGAVPAAHLAARRHGRPDPGLGADPRRHHGDRRRVHGGAAVAAVRAGAQRAEPSSPSSAPPPRSSPPPSAWCRTTSSASSPIRPARSSATCSSPWAVGAYSVGMFHLFTHAFFKALLFLGSGSVIHAMHHEQDIRHMGGLKDRIPYTYIVMIIGTLALTGFPLTAGYFSKDAIIEAAFVGEEPNGVLWLHLHGRRRAAHLVLFLAADLQDLPRRAARPQALEGRRMRARW